jgi:methionyl aminopeptidase
VVHLKADWELAVMRANGRRLAEVAALMRETIAIGVTTSELDRIADERIRSLGALPSFKNYLVEGAPPYPATICASVNNQVVHGIPDSRPLESGDLLSIDLGLHYGGYHADMAFTVVVGEGSEAARRLLDATEQSLYIGISRAQPGLRVGDIGHAIESHLKPLGLGIVRQYVGHGIGRAMHERPSVPNYGKANTGDLLKPGLCIAIEPMVTLGSGRTRVLKDRWTVVTADDQLAAHFEHTLCITPTGPEVLTVLEGQRLPLPTIR